MFTIHNNSKDPVNDQGESIVTSFTIETEEIPGAQQFLKLSRVNPYTIYPDFGGLAGYIRGMLTSQGN